MCMHTENALARACDRGGNRHGGGYRRGQAMQAGVHILMELPDAQERHLKKLGKNSGISASLPVRVQRRSFELFCQSLLAKSSSLRQSVIVHILM